MIQLLGLLACTLAAPGPPERPDPPPPAPPVEVQVDLHVDTPSRLVDEGMSFDDPRLEAGIPRLREAGTNLVVEALWPARRTPTARVHQLLDRMTEEDERRDDVAIVRSPDDALDAIRAGRIALVLGIEGAHGLAEDWQADVAALDHRGLRVLGLTWSLSNRFAGSSGDRGGGLTAEGRALLAEVERRGWIVDLSHASRATTLEVCRTARSPVIASHSGATAICDVPRNLTDEEIGCIAATGGVIGLNLHAPFLCGAADLTAAVAHLEHLARIGGRDAVSLSTDFDGTIQVPSGLEHEGKVTAILDALRARGWNDDEIRGVRGENFLRAWRGVSRSPTPRPSAGYVPSP